MSSVNGVTNLLHYVLIVFDPHEDDARARVDNSIINLWTEMSLWNWLETKLDDRNRPPIAS